MRVFKIAFSAVAGAICLSACGGGVSLPAQSPVSTQTPCAAPQTPGPASTQTKARLGAYYFDGWSGPLSNFHFDGLPSGAYQGREPVTGWQDSSTCAVEQQLAWAHKFGIDFFIFDWYFNVTVNDPGENLNNALEVTHAVPNRYGMQYAILYVDSPPFVATTSDWPNVINEWANYMTDPAYVRVNGRPLLMIIDMGQMHNVFGSSSGVAAALNQLRAVALAKGLPGVFVVGEFGVPTGSSGQDALFPDLSWSASDGYDAVSTYNYPDAPTQVKGARPFSDLSAAGAWIWNQCAIKCPFPAIPVAMDGWDPRPWNPQAFNWYQRTPSDVATFVSETIALANSNGRLRVEPAPTPPMVLMEAWNELGEGSYVVPTIGAGSDFGDVLAAMLTSSGVTTSTRAKVGPH